MLEQRIIGMAIEVHRAGPGLLESVYAACMCFELEQAGIPLSRQVTIPRGAFAFGKTRNGMSAAPSASNDPCGSSSTPATDIPLFK